MATGRSALDLSIHVQGVQAILRELGQLPPNSVAVLKRRTKEIGRELAERVRAAGRADTRQSARAAATVRFRATGGAIPGGKVTAGPHPLLFGSEFGMNRRTGWYADDRFRHSPGRQFRRHYGQHSYWFFRSAEEAQPWVEQQFREAVDEIVRDFRAS
jgi:hypothetical protein